jgi:hypothetical protein
LRFVRLESEERAASDTSDLANTTLHVSMDSVFSLDALRAMMQRVSVDGAP